MAQTEYGVNAPEAVKLWSKKLNREALKKCWIGPFISEDDNALVQKKTETSKGAGDRVTITLRMQLTGAGVLGDSTLEGNEESLTTYTDNLLINQLRHAVRSRGKMTEQRIPFSIREEARTGLTDWWSDRFDASFFNQVAGKTDITDTRYTGLNASIAATTVRRPNSVANDQSLGTSDTFTLGLIDACVAIAKTATPMIRPLKIKGEDRYALFMHPFQVRDMRTNTNSGQWLDIQKAAMAGGDIEDNPIRSGMLGIYNGVMLYESVRVPNGVNSATGANVANTRRSVFCGAQAAAIGFGKGYDSTTSADWNEELFDYGNQLGVSAGFIFGLKKLVFNSSDFGNLVISTYAA